MTKNAVIIPAAGSGTRMKLNYPKQYHEIAGAPILIHTIQAFVHHPAIDTVVVVIPKDRLESTAQLLSEYNLDPEQVQLVAGGIRRQDSVYNGLKSLSADTDVVLVHDGARPMVRAELITACLETAQGGGGAIAAVPVTDTIKKGNASNLVVATVNREDLWKAQTPQAAQYTLLMKAYEVNGDDDVTDESSLLEKAGIPVILVEGSETNIKITRPEDILLATTIMQKDEPAPKPDTTMKIGHGFDAHRFSENRKLVLGGVEIPHTLGLAGHSDADVLTHALCDALLGAIGAGDIGRHFPDSSDKFKDIYSIKLLEQVIEQVEAKGLKLGNADITVVCQRPKLAPHLEKMTATIAEACNTVTENINIKATTTEKMGFTGREEGISCHAVVLLT